MTLENKPEIVTAGLDDLLFSPWFYIGIIVGFGFVYWLKTNHPDKF